MLHISHGSVMLRMHVSAVASETIDSRNTCASLVPYSSLLLLLVSNSVIARASAVFCASHEQVTSVTVAAPSLRRNSSVAPIADICYACGRV